MMLLSGRIKNAWSLIKVILLSEAVSYVFFGAVTTLVNIASFQLFYVIIGVPTLISNVIAWVFSVAVAYVTNRRFVFHSAERSPVGVVREIAAFVGARAMSLVFDELVVWLMVDIMGYNVFEQIIAQLFGTSLDSAKALFAKLCSNVVVVALNFIFSKFFIFRKKKEIKSMNERKGTKNEQQ